jgi:glycosyltransferase involved in cell wall biosynthesis
LAKASPPLKNVLLIHENSIQHYRVPVYGYLHGYLRDRGYDLTVVAEGIQKGSESSVEFPFIKMKISLRRLIRVLSERKPQVCILFAHLRNPYCFPFLLFLKASAQKAVIWTHGANLQHKNSKASALLHHMEHALCDGIILYAEYLRTYIAKSHQQKVFVANNTLNVQGYQPQLTDKHAILRKYGIASKKNIIFVGRLQKRKRIQDLFLAFDLLDESECGLVLVGPDEEGIVAQMPKKNPRIYSIGPLYGTDALDLLCACDVSCIPGAVGLSIVDAMYCGLPVVTERVDHGPEIMYLHDGKNGFMVEKGDYRALADRIRILLEDEELRLRFSQRAREEIETAGNINNLCKGFLDCLDYVTHSDNISQQTG